MPTKSGLFDSSIKLGDYSGSSMEVCEQGCIQFDRKDGRQNEFTGSGYFIGQTNPMIQSAAVAL
jgi:hypothetical protein